MADRRRKEGPIGTSSTTGSARPDRKPTGAQAGAMARNGSTRPWAILATARSLKGAAPAPCVARNGRDDVR
jgi:hypothetical protein